MTTTPAVQPERILKELRQLWADLGKTEEHGVLRACAMTLIVAAHANEDPQSLGETLAAIMHEHPSRAIVIRVRDGAGEPVEARVFAQCWMPFGKRQQICCEQVEFVATPDMLAEAAAVIRALVVPDLPTVLYCRDAALLEQEEFECVTALASKIVLDSTAVENSEPVLRRLSVLARPARFSADLAWARLTPWREAIAQIFDHPAARAFIYKLEDIRILYAHADEPAAAYYLAGWFLHVLGGEPHIRIARGIGPAYAGIARVSVQAPGFEASVELMEDQSVEVVAGGERQRLVFPPETEQNSLRAELAIAGRDKLFEHVLGFATLLRSAQG